MVDWVARLIELDLDVVPERLIACPLLESYALPELSIILVLGAVDELLLVTEEPLLPEMASLVEVVPLLPEIALLLPLLFLDEVLPERSAIEALPLVVALLL